MATFTQVLELESRARVLAAVKIESMPPSTAVHDDMLNGRSNGYVSFEFLCRPCIPDRNLVSSNM